MGIHLNEGLLAIHPSRNLMCQPSGERGLARSRRADKKNETVQWCCLEREPLTHRQGQQRLGEEPLLDPSGHLYRRPGFRKIVPR
jgi:hypothetical protein